MNRRHLVAIVLLIVITIIPFSRVGTFQFVNYDDEQYITGNRHIQQGLDAGTIGWAFTTFRNSNWHPVTWISHAIDVALFGLRPGFHHAVNLLLHVANTALVFAFVLLLFRHIRVVRGPCYSAKAAKAAFATKHEPPPPSGEIQTSRQGSGFVQTLRRDTRRCPTYADKTKVNLETALPQDAGMAFSAEGGQCGRAMPVLDPLQGRGARQGGVGSCLFPAFFIAAIFAIHPLHVESVAWVSERKDLLAGFFGLATLICYFKSAVGAGKPMRSRWYWCALALFALGLMSKPMLVTLPFLMLLLDYWPLRQVLCRASPRVTPSDYGEARLDARSSPTGNGACRASPCLPDEVSPRRLGVTLAGIVVEKLPFFLLTIVFVAVTYIAQSGGAVVPRWALQAVTRLINAVVSYGIYLTQFIWPQGLAPFYPYTVDKAIPWTAFAASLLALALISAATWLARRSKPWLLVGWLWFIGMLVPVIGIVQVGEQAHADRYVYLPMLGLLLMVAGIFFEQGGDRVCSCGRPASSNRDIQPRPGRSSHCGQVADLEERGQAGPAAHRSAVWTLPCFVIPSAAILILMSLTWRQVGYWRDSVTLFQRALDVTENNYLAHFNLGLALQRRNDMSGAVNHYIQALNIDPRHVRARNGLAVIMATNKRLPEAERLLREALAIEPVNAEINFNLGNVMLEQGRPVEAESYYKQAIESDPDDPDARYLLGIAQARQGRVGEASTTWRELLAIDPRNVDARRQLQKAETMQGSRLK